MSRNLHYFIPSFFPAKNNILGKIFRILFIKHLYVFVELLNIMLLHRCRKMLIKILSHKYHTFLLYLRYEQQTVYLTYFEFCCSRKSKEGKNFRNVYCPESIYIVAVSPCLVLAVHSFKYIKARKHNCFK